MADSAADNGVLATSGAVPAAVVVRGARKCYVTNKWVLDGLDLTVPEASIYALLGASGCGKTTLLTCLLGLRHLNAGDITVMGWRPGAPGAGIPGRRVGFMPQELALSEGFSIGETLHYFGKVARLSDDVIERRSQELLDFLQVPAKRNRLISELSGGQKQRVSLAVTLLNSPPLLILDEPTVGVDPILRQNIWDFLVDLTRKSRTTVVITTHYIEEARQANQVGLMRRGKLLDEDFPDKMMDKYGCSSLEDVFLKLSLQQDGMDVAPASTKPCEDHLGVVSTMKTPPCNPHSNVMACMWRAWLYLVRYKWVTAYFLMMPVLCLLIFVYAVGVDPKGLHLAVVNAESDCTAGWPGYPPSCEDTPVPELGCRFITLLLESNDFYVDTFRDAESAREAVKSGDAWGMILFPANFSTHLTRRLYFARDAEDADLDGSEFDVHLDMSDQLVSNLIRAALFDAALRFHRDFQVGCGLNTRFTAVPINEMEPVYGVKRPAYQDFALPGMLMCIMFFPAIFYSTANFLEDKLNGVMNRSAASGVTQFEMLAARAVLDCAINAVSAAVVLVSTFFVFQFSYQGSVVLIALLLYAMGLCGLWVGYFVAAMCSSHYTATFLGMGIFFTTTFMSGMFWPAQGMHWLIRFPARVSPMLPAVEAMRTVLYQGSDPTLIGLGFLGTIGWIAGLVLGTLAVLRLQNKTG